MNTDSQPVGQLSADTANENEDHPLQSLAEDAVDAIDGDALTLGNLLDAFGTKGFGPLITVFALVAAIPPIGGIPGLPTIMGVLIFLMAGQLLAQREHPWVPDWLEKKGIDRKNVEKAQEKSARLFEKIDRLIGPRLEWATGKAGQTSAALACLILAVMMPPLELVPFAVAIPASVVALFGIAITARDGLLMLIAGGGFIGALFLGSQYLLA